MLRNGITQIRRATLLGRSARQSTATYSESGFVALPSERTSRELPGQGWDIPTTIKKSNIPGANNGRFVDTDVPKDTIVVTKQLIPMSDISSILDVGSDEVIIFKNKEEIETFIGLYEKEGQRSREEIVDCLAHFIWSFHNTNGLCINFSTWTVNHGCPGDTENIHFYHKDDAILGKTVTDVKAGDELYNNYRDFDHMDDYWINFCKDEGVKDVVTNLKQYVDL